MNTLNTIAEWFVSIADSIVAIAYGHMSENR